MITFQEFEKLFASDATETLLSVINDWKSGEIYKTAVIADTYDRQRNDTIMNYVKMLFTLTGTKVQDFTATNNKITSNYFRRLNVQRNTYLFGNGITFPKEGIKERFGKRFDTTIKDAGYFALIHGVSFPYVGDRLYFFKATEFAPLWDEETGALRAGIRFWQIDSDKPTYMVLYEQDGYTKYRKDGEDVQTVDEKRAYLVTTQTTTADGVEVIDAGNYPFLPIVPFWGSSLHQSTLIGNRSKIDSYDLIRSGFANDLNDVAQIYFILENFGGMRDEDLARFRDRLKLAHIAEADTSNGGKITPYTQEIPFEARQAYLTNIREGIYEDFGGFDTRSMSATAKTATEIQSAYQPLDEEADDYETQAIECVQSLGAVLGIPEEDATPQFKRNRVANQLETVEVLTSVAEYLDEETILKKLPFVDPDEIEEILRRKAEEDVDRFGVKGAAGDEEGEEDGI